MTNWLDRLLGTKPTSADAAKERLKLVLIHDRTELTPAQLESLKDELLKVIARYVDIDPTAVNINMTQEGREQRLVADVPLKAAPHRRRSA
jgi:cell division topological specificity factor